MGRTVVFAGFAPRRCDPLPRDGRRQATPERLRLGKGGLAFDVFSKCIGVGYTLIPDFHRARRRRSAWFRCPTTCSVPAADRGGARARSCGRRVPDNRTASPGPDRDQADAGGSRPVSSRHGRVPGSGVAQGEAMNQSMRVHGSCPVRGFRNCWTCTGPLEMFGLLAPEVRIVTVAETSGLIASLPGVKTLAEHGFAGCAAGPRPGPGALARPGQVNNGALLARFPRAGPIGGDHRRRRAPGSASWLGPGPPNGRRATSNKQLFKQRHRPERPGPPGARGAVGRGRPTLLRWASPWAPTWPWRAIARLGWPARRGGADRRPRGVRLGSSMPPGYPFHPSTSPTQGDLQQILAALGLRLTVATHARKRARLLSFATTPSGNGGLRASVSGRAGGNRRCGSKKGIAPMPGLAACVRPLRAEAGVGRRWIHRAGRADRTRAKPLERLGCWRAWGTRTPGIRLRRRRPWPVPART